MTNTLSQMIDQISREKGIDPKVIHEALEQAMVAAAGRYFKTEENLQADFDPDTGVIQIFAVKEVVEEVEDPELEMSVEEARKYDDTFEVGDFIEIPKPTMGLGRIAAQTAKQVIVQKVREAEREIIFGEFSDQIGSVVNGIVRRFEGRDVVLDIGRTEALLPYPEQSRNEEYTMGDRIRAVIIRVHRLAKGPQIVVSRTDPSLLIRLFESEIPEVYDGTVVIKNCVREGGERAKVAVSSREESVDPVGACVGMKGSRINAVIRELRGEKIDIIAYSNDIVEYTINALNPAKISKVLISDPENKILEVVVPEDQLSLAIGRKGQNVRLASKLLGWEINIKSDEEKKREILSEMDQLSAVPTDNSLDDLPGIGDVMKSRLKEAGIDSIDSLAEKSLDELTAIPGIGEKTAEKLMESARTLAHAKKLGIEESDLQAGEAETVESTTVTEEVAEEEPREKVEAEQVATDTEEQVAKDEEERLEQEPSVELTEKTE